MRMRLILVLVAVGLASTLAITPAVAQDGQPSTAAGNSSSSAQDTAAADAAGKDATPLNLPVSVDKIRQALEQPPAPPLRGLDEQPTFRVEIRETQRLEELMQSLTFDTGPVPPGGVYGYDQQQSIWSKQQHPEMQPYGAFSQGQLLTIALENLLEKYLAAHIGHAIADSQRAAAEAAAREEVRRALDAFWAAQAARQP